MDILDAIRGRRSIRRFKPNAIPKEKQEKIIEAAKWAPSAGNQQTRELLLIENQDTKNKLSEAAYGQNFIAEAPLVLVACANTTKSSRIYGTRGRNLYSIQDAAAAMQNILLASHSLGLGSCWVGAFDEQQVRKILKIPEDVIPMALIPIGVPDEDPQPPKRKIEVHKEKW